MLYRGIGFQEDRFYDGLRYRFRGQHLFAWGLGPEGFPDVGVGRAWKKADDANSARAQFLAQGVGEAESRMFRSIVGSGSGENAGGGDREIVDNRAAALHQAERGLRHDKHPVDIGSKNIFPDRVREILDWQVRMSDAGVVDEDVDRAELAPYVAEEVVDGVGIADDARLSNNADFLTGQFPAQLTELVLIPGGEDQRAAFLRQSAGNCKADAARGTGNEGYAASEAGL